MSVLAMKATLEVQQEVFLSVCLCLHTICSLIAQSLNTVCKEFADSLQFIISLSGSKTFEVTVFCNVISKFGSFTL